jgi:hypothetical protein
LYNGTGIEGLYEEESLFPIWLFLINGSKNLKMF